MMSDEVRELARRLDNTPIDGITQDLQSLLTQAREDLTSRLEASSELRRQAMERELLSSTASVKEFMQQRFLTPPSRDTVLWEGYNPSVLPAEDLERRLDTTLRRASNGTSAANCLRACSRRVYYSWGMACFTTLCWVLGIERTP